MTPGAFPSAMVLSMAVSIDCRVWGGRVRASPGDSLWAAVATGVTALMVMAATTAAASNNDLLEVRAVLGRDTAIRSPLSWSERRPTMGACRRYFRRTGQRSAPGEGDRQLLGGRLVEVGQNDDQQVDVG